MSIWSRLRAMFARATKASDPGGETSFWFGGRTTAGVYIDGDTMLRNPVVWACVQYLTRAVGQLPWRVLQEEENGGNKRVPRHPVDWLIHKRPNAEMGAMTFRQTLLTAALTRGNGYAEIQRDARGVPVALWPIATDRVQPKRREDDGSLFYRVNNGGGFVDIDAMNMFHLRGFPGPDGVVGLDVMTYAAQTIGWAQATEMFGASFFGEGLNPAGVVQTPKGMSAEGKKQLEHEFDKKLKGPRKSNKTIFLDEGMTWTRVSSEPDKAQFIETMQHQVDTICRFFGVPPHKVMHLLRATFSNIEHQSIEVVTDSVAPWCKLFEEEADYKLFGASNRQGFFTKLYLQALLRGDSASRATFYKTMVETGAFTANMILLLEDMNPIGPKGDKHVMQSQYTTLERIGEEPVKQIAAPAADDGEDDAAEDAAPTPPRKTNANGSGLPH